MASDRWTVEEIEAWLSDFDSLRRLPGRGQIRALLLTALDALQARDEAALGLERYAKEARDSNVASVAAKLHARSAMGLRKYGVTTERTDLSERDWLQHLQEELMDGAVYCQRLLAGLDAEAGDGE